jgi:hypothetical protein
VGVYSEHLIFFLTYKLDQYVRVFSTGKPFQLIVMKLSSLLYWFVSYEENEVLWMCTLILISDLLVLYSLSIISSVSGIILYYLEYILYK